MPKPQNEDVKVRTPAEQQEGAERRQDTAGESHEGAPGYGQPPKEAREAPLPEQNWGSGSKESEE